MITGESQLHALEVESGALLWRYEAEEWLAPLLAASDGKSMSVP